MNEFSKEQLEAMRIVKSDLDYIKKMWGGEIDDDSLRRNSTILRQLLIDEGGLLIKIQRMLNVTLYIQAPVSPLKSEKLEKITFYSAGSGISHGFEVSSFIIGNYVPSPTESEKMNQNGTKNNTKKYNLEEFLSAPSIIVNGNIFSRLEVIKFVANKLGGAHLEMDNKKLARMKLLVPVKENDVIANRNAIYFEFLSIGQLLAKSKYTDKLIKKISEIID
ncbi:MAG TPA: hypothetical protein VMR41_02650 [Patescibacteria group bacterium]|nr:hypothetical protein [Patescibacteria group bacterium]